MNTSAAFSAEIVTNQLDWLLRTPCKGLFSPAAADDIRPNTMPRIVCADGESLSVQASRTHYCSPRDCYGPWEAVEVGFPSVPVPEWAAFKDGPQLADTAAVFGYVPVELVRAFIAAHGGEKQALPPGEEAPAGGGRK